MNWLRRLRVASVCVVIVASAAAATAGTKAHKVTYVYTVRITGTVAVYKVLHATGPA